MADLPRLTTTVGSPISKFTRAAVFADVGRETQTLTLRGSGHALRDGAQTRSVVERRA